MSPKYTVYVMRHESLLFVIVYFTVQSIILYDSYITMGHIPLARYDHMQVKPVGKETITII